MEKGKSWNMEKQKESALQGLGDKIDSFFLKNWSSYLQMAGLTLLLLTVQIWQLNGYDRLSLTSFMLGVICLCEASSVAIRFKQDLQSQFRKNTVFLLLLEGVSLLFLLVNCSEIIEVIGSFGEVILMIGLAVVIAAQGIQMYFTTHRWKPDKAVMKEYLLLGCLCLVFGFLLNIECFNTWPRWDSFHYYRTMELCSAKNIFLSGEEGLRACGHISTAYSLWSLLFQMIPGITNLNAMYLSNMALISVAVVLFYFIFKRIYPDNYFLLNFLYTIVCVASPLLFGLSANLSMELLLAVGILLLVYSTFINNSILGIFSLFIVVTSKETGVVIAATVVSVQLVYDICQWYRVKSLDFNRLIYYCLCLSLGISWLLQFRSGAWMSGGNAYYLTTQDGVEFNHFGFSKIHIKDTLVGSFLPNFNWLFSFFILIAAFLFLVRLFLKKKVVSAFFHNQKWVIISAGLISYTFVMCFYVTYHIYRYYITTTVLLCILGFGSLQYILKTVCNKRVLQIGIPIILSCLFFLESHMTIDPITKILYEGIRTGKSVVTPIPVHSSADIDPSFQDVAYSNRLILYFDKALDKAFAAIYNASPSAETKILFSNEYQARIVNGKVTLGSLYCIWGFGYSYGDYPMWGHWNAEGGYRYLSCEEEGNIDPSYVQASTDLSGYLSDYKHVYYIKMPWGDTVLEPLMKRYPSVSYEQTIEYRSWVFEIYRIK